MGNVLWDTLTSETGGSDSAQEIWVYASPLCGALCHVSLISACGINQNLQIG